MRSAHIGTEIRFSRTGYLADRGGRVLRPHRLPRRLDQGPPPAQPRAQQAGQVGRPGRLCALALRRAGGALGAHLDRAVLHPGQRCRDRHGPDRLGRLRRAGHGRHVERRQHHRRGRRAGGGLGTFCFAVLAIMGYWIFRHCTIYHVLPASAIDLALVAVALAGACIGFLWWNAAPAKIIMGDTGSLAIGAGFAALCLLLNLELLLPIIGGLFVMETLSVIAQVISFRVFHRRIFRMAPDPPSLRAGGLARDHGDRALLGLGRAVLRVWASASSTPTSSRWRSSRDDAPPLSATSPMAATTWRMRRVSDRAWLQTHRRRVAAVQRSPGRRRQRGATAPPASRPVAGRGAGPRRPTHRARARSRGWRPRSPAADRVSRCCSWSSLLCVIGLVMVGSASSVISISLYGSPWAILIREGMWMAVGVWRWAGAALRLPQAAPAEPAALVGHVRAPPHCPGARARCARPGLEPVGWFRPVPAPAVGAHEAVPDAVLCRFHRPAARRGSDRPSHHRARCSWSPASPASLILAQPDMGTAMVLGCIALTLLFVSGVRLGPVLKLLAGLAGWP